MPGNADDRELRALLRGEPAAVRRAERWARAVVAARRLGIPEREREDLVQETLLALLRQAARPDFTIRSSLPALVKAIAAARCIDWLRRRRPQAELLEEPAAPQPSPEQQVIVLAEIARADALLAGLEAKQRQILLLRLRDQLSFAEIARLTGVREGTLRVRLHEGLKRLRTQLAQAERLPKGPESSSGGGSA